MVADERAVADALAGGHLGGRAIRLLTIPRCDDVAFAIDITGQELLPAWRAARAVVDRLGRWPVATLSWDDEPVTSRVFVSAWNRGLGAGPRELASASRAVSLDVALESFPAIDEYWDQHWDDWVEIQLQSTARRVGHAPTAAEIMALDLRPDTTALDAWLMAWEEARRPTTVPDDGGHLDWYEPDVSDPCALVLLPTPACEDVAVHLGFWGVETREETIAFGAILRSWRERFGAEVVANWGTMLQFVVSRPPASLEDAFTLAAEQGRVAPSTFGLPGVELRDHARALLERPTWFLHERP